MRCLQLRKTTDDFSSSVTCSTLQEYDVDIVNDYKLDNILWTQKKILETFTEFYVVSPNKTIREGADNSYLLGMPGW